MHGSRKFLSIIVIFALFVEIVSCGSIAQREQITEPDVPLKGRPDADGGLSYALDIQPVFDEYCITCHGPDKAENDLELNSYENTMKGGRSGAVVIPGWPEASTLVYVLRRKESEEIAMPYHGRKLTPNRIKNVMTWIEAGAPNN